MKPHGQCVRTRGAARPRNLAAGCAAVLVVLAALFLLGWFLRTAPAPPDPAPPAVETAPPAAQATAP